MKRDELVSYLDGLLLTGVLPAGYVFVAKHEMSQVPLASWLLRRLGIAFVNRENPAQGARDARSILRRAQQGTSFAFFPEGTIPRGGALGPFRLGAFLTAAELQCPVVPISLEGTERVMPDDHRWRVYHHPIRVRIHAPIHPKGRNRPDLAWLRDQARMRIARSLEKLGSGVHDGGSCVHRRRCGALDMAPPVQGVGRRNGFRRLLTSPPRRAGQRSASTRTWASTLRASGLMT